MTLRNRMKEFTAVEQVDEFLEQHPTCAIFKAGGCHKTMQGFGFVEEALNPRENISMGYVKVIQNRPVSNYITEMTGIVHQSPQFILFVKGKPVYDVDNWDITPEALSSALNEYLGTVSKESSESSHKGDVRSYVDLLEQLIDNRLSESDFISKWIMTFKADATPRSKKEFALLNGLLGQEPDNETLKEKAQRLLKELQA